VSVEKNMEMKKVRKGNESWISRTVDCFFGSEGYLPTTYLQHCVCMKKERKKGRKERKRRRSIGK